MFECPNVELLAFLPLIAIGSGLLNAHVGGYGSGDLLSGVWGWTDSATGREFALVGRNSGTSFIEVTDPLHPKYLGTCRYIGAPSRVCGAT